MILVSGAGDGQGAGKMLRMEQGSTMGNWLQCASGKAFQASGSWRFERQPGKSFTLKGQRLTVKGKWQSLKGLKKRLQAW